MFPSDVQVSLTQPPLTGDDDEEGDEDDEEGDEDVLCVPEAGSRVE